MPIYDYFCSSCQETFESIVKKPQKTKKCPTCNNRAKRIISGSKGLIFKGPGFFSWENRSQSYLRDAAKEIRGE